VPSTQSPRTGEGLESGHLNEPLMAVDRFSPTAKIDDKGICHGREDSNGYIMFKTSMVSLTLFGWDWCQVSIQILVFEANCMHGLHYKVGRWVLNGYFSLTSLCLIGYEHTVIAGLHLWTM
jgi:hypothetical protein